MNFRIAIIKCFMLYFVFKGRAKRAEFWWFFLFLMILAIMTSIIDSNLGTEIVTNNMGTISEADDQKTGIFSVVTQLITFIPGLAVTARRLHDTNRSGWWQLLWIAPFITIPIIIAQGFIALFFLIWIFSWTVLFVFLYLPTIDSENNYHWSNTEQKVINYIKEYLKKK